MVHNDCEPTSPHTGPDHYVQTIHHLDQAMVALGDDIRVAHEAAGSERTRTLVNLHNHTRSMAALLNQALRPPGESRHDGITST